MLWRFSYRELLGHPLRSALVVLGVSVATAMMVSMLMLGAGIGRSFAELLVARGYTLRVSPRGTLPLETRATLADAESLRADLLAQREVAGVAPVLGGNLLVRSRSAAAASAGAGRGAGAPGGAEPAGGAEDPAGGSDALRVFALGVDPTEQGVYRLLEGREPEAEGEILIGGELAGGGFALGEGLDLGRPGDFTGPMTGASFHIVGVAEFVYTSRGERPIAMRLADLQKLTERPDAASFLMLRLNPDFDPTAAAERLRDRFPQADVASVQELVERAEARLSYFRQLALVLGAVSLFVAVLLVGTLMSVSINDRYGSIAALRAIGFSRRSLVSAFAGEGLVLCGVAGSLGLGLGVAVAGYLDAVLSDFPGLPLAVEFFVLEAGDLGTGYATLVLAGLLATLVPAWRAASLDIAQTLHQEEP